MPPDGSPIPGTLGCFGCGNVPFAQPPTASATASDAAPHMFLTTRINGCIVPPRYGAAGANALVGPALFADVSAPEG